MWLFQEAPWERDTGNIATPLRVVAALRVVVAFVVVVGGAAAAILIFKGLESMEHELVLRCARRNWSE